MKIATAQQMRDMDRVAIQERGIPSVQLMETAARAVADAALELAAKHRKGKEGPGRAVCFCGAGNNGGDGVCTARLLLEAGLEVRAVLVGKREKMTPDCREMERRLEDLGGQLEDFNPNSPEFALWCLEADVMVDALFGIGLNTELRGNARTAVQMMNTCDIPVVAADIASGVEADTGKVLGDAVQADVTVTFSLPKAGQFLGQGGLHTGELKVADIGIPLDLILWAEENQFSSVTREDLFLPRRPRDAHKGDFGRVYILGGAVGYSGAPVLAAKAALRTGAGLVTVGVPAPVWPVAAAKLDEAMPHPLPAGKEGMLSLEAMEPVMDRLSACDVALIGPGLGRGNSASSVVRHLIRAYHGPLILDADGINALEGHMDILEARKGLITVLTPHDGEFARLGGDLSDGDRLAAARRFAEEYQCCLILKGYRTITALPDGQAFVNTTGNPGMSKGGSGDILGGMLLALMGQGLSVREAAPMAVWMHGRAGDLAAADLGEYGMLPGDLVERIPRVLRECEGRRS